MPTDHTPLPPAARPSAVATRVVPASAAVRAAPPPGAAPAYLFQSPAGPFVLAPDGGRVVALFNGNRLGRFASPETAAVALALGLVAAAPGVPDLLLLGLPADLRGWERVAEAG